MPTPLYLFVELFYSRSLRDHFKTNGIFLMNFEICVKTARALTVVLFAIVASNVSFAGDMANKDIEAGMYTKVYWLTFDPNIEDAVWEHYDTVSTPMIKEGEFHGGIAHQFIAAEPGKYILVANYKSKESSVAAAPLVGKIVGPMVEKFGIKLELIAEGDIKRLVRK